MKENEMECGENCCQNKVACLLCHLSDVATSRTGHDKLHCIKCEFHRFVANISSTVRKKTHMQIVTKAKIHGNI